MNDSNKSVHIYRCEDIQLTLAIALLSDGREMEIMPIYTSPLDDSDDLSHCLELAYANTGSTVSNAINPWQTQEGRSLSEADIFCEISWMTTGIRLIPYRLVVDEIDDERGWMEDVSATIELGEAPSFQDIAVAVTAYFKKGGENERSAMADNTAVTGSTDTTTGYEGDMG